jgi:hypothetical protein
LGYIGRPHPIFRAELGRRRGRGELKPPAKTYLERIGEKGVDYRAMRIVRAENSKAMNDAIKNAEAQNPRATGKYEWKL